MFYLKSQPVKILVQVLLIIILIFSLFRGGLFQKGIDSGNYPSGAVHFLKQNRLSGNMFNPYDWGGYLIWQLYPDYKVFTDGRELQEEIFWQHVSIMKGSSQTFGGIPEWKLYLEAYGINFIITYSVDSFSWSLIPLVSALLYDEEWQLIYLDKNSLIFVRDIPCNVEIIHKFAMPKEMLWNEVIVESALKGKPTDPVLLREAMSAITSLSYNNIEK